MRESISQKNSDIVCIDSNPHESVSEKNLLEITEDILYDACADISKKNTLSIPIAQLAVLGAGVSSLSPTIRTITQTTTVHTQGLYYLANAAVGDTLKVAKNGNFWGAFKTADGASKFAQLQAAGPLSATNTVVKPIDPATMLMAAALFSIEQRLGDIAEMERQILSFLEIEKESEIKADVEMLLDIITNYKFNWDNEHFIASNHKLVRDIQRTARKHMNSYQKKVSDVLDLKQLIVTQSKVNATLKELQKMFKYYRLSLYTFSMASLIEIMLSGNFREEYIIGIKSEMEALSMVYRDIYGRCSVYLEKLSGASLETNVLKGIGTTGKAVGKFIGSIPVVKESMVDEFLEESSLKLKKNTANMEKEVIESFAEISNPGTRVFVEKMNEMIRIYSHTTDICFDEKQIYLVMD